jgi:uncharacterized membrane protein YeaQ/YmgE (transglycosylase-associated protein family)
MSGWFLRLIYLLVLAFIIGSLAQMITGYRKRPVITTFVLGFIGVVVGDFAAKTLHLPWIIPPIFGIAIFWSIIGSVVFILLFALLRGRL